jgi:hypothetical protein
MSTTTESITDTARAFFDACETGKGWAECHAHCRPDAGFSARPNRSPTSARWRTTRSG